VPGGNAMGNKKLLDLTMKEYAKLPMEEFNRRLQQERTIDTINKIRANNGIKPIGEQ
jgi:hypothetical protein